MPIRNRADEPPSLNLTPMIDCVFLLLIFFLLGTKFTELERKIGLRIPEVTDSGALSPAPEKRIINVYRDGTISLDQQPVTLEELTRRLAEARRQYSDLGVLVRGDSQGQFQRVAEVLNSCKQADIQELGICVRPMPPERPR